MTLCSPYDVQNSDPADLRTALLIKCMRDGSDFYLDGMIDSDLLFEIQSSQFVKVKRLFLNSPGGRVDDAKAIAEYIRDNQITTVVRDKAQCLSACTLLFQAGVDRYAHESALFMYHSARYLRESRAVKEANRVCVKAPTLECHSEFLKKRRNLQRVTKSLFALYTQYDASPDLYAQYSNRPEDPVWFESGNYLKTEDWYMSAQESLEYNIATHIIL